MVIAVTAPFTIMALSHYTNTNINKASGFTLRNSAYFAVNAFMFFVIC